MRVESKPEFAHESTPEPTVKAKPEVRSRSEGKPIAPGGSGFSLWLVVAVVALALAGWQWVETRQRLAGTQQEMARRLAESDTIVKENRALARHAQEQVDLMQGKFGELEGKIAESTSQQAALEGLYRDLAGNREEWVLAEIEQSVTLAAQQLQLAANVPAAVLALQAADARLAGSNRPQFISLRKVLVQDLDRLRATPQIDLPGMNVRLESVIAAVDALPLAVDVRPQEQPVAADESGTSAPDTNVPVATDAPAEPAALTALKQLARVEFWQRLGRDFWGEFRSLIRIQRFDREEPALLAPGQDYFLRENLKLRLLSARLALLSHDQWLFRNELQEATTIVDQYFNGQEQSVRTVRESLRQLSAAEINIEVPNLNASMSAIKNFKLAGDAS